MRSELILAVADHEFDVAIAGFSFAMWVGDPTSSWHVRIECEEREIDGSRWEPHLSDRGVEVPRPELHRVVGFSAADGLTSALEFEEPAFTLYQWDHLPVEDVRMRVGDVVSHGVEFHLTGTVQLHDHSSLGRVGFGWLRPSAVRAELERMWSSEQDQGRPTDCSP